MVTKRLIPRIFTFLFVIIFTLAGIPRQTANAAGVHIPQQAGIEKAPAQGGLNSSVLPLSSSLNGARGSIATDGQALKSAIPPLIVVVDPNPAMQGIRAPVEPKLQAAIDAAGVHSAAAGATFSFTFQPAGSVDPWGAVCQTFPETAKVAFNAAAAIWSYFIQSTVPIAISACWSSPAYMPSAGTLGYSGGEGYFKNFTGAPKPDTWYESSLANALHRSDLDPSGFDDYITYNAGFPWYYGTDGSVPAGQYDLVTVAAHEIAHGLNFSGTASYSAGTGGYGISGYPNIWDTFIEDSTGKKLTGYANPSTALGSLLTSNNLWFDGANANAGNGGGRVKIYAPSPWAGGSSYSHLDYSYAGGPNSMMVYSIGSGSSQHNPGPITQGLLKDLGWVLDEQNALHVKPVASGTGDCSSWANACTLQTGLSVAASGDQLWVAKGTYKPTDGTDRWAHFQLKSGIAIYGGFAGTEVARAQRNLSANVTILSGDIGTAGDISDNSDNVVVGSGTDATAILDGFTITGGNADCPCAGGGIYNNAGSPSLSNLIFSNNSAGWGGGMFNDASNPSLTNITFNNNSATNTGGGMENQDNSNPSLANVSFNSNTASWGGGMANYTGIPSLTNVTFSNNSATGGGGIYNYASSPTLASVTFSVNNASANGGGIFNENGSSPDLTEVTLSNNFATSNGGGMYNSSSSPTLTDVTFSTNTTDGNGAGMYNLSSSPTLTRVTFDSNGSYTTSGNGGGIYNDSSSPTLTDVTFSSNTAVNNGGGMNNTNASNPSLTDVTFNGNSAWGFDSGSGGGGGMYNNASDPSLSNVTFISNDSSEYGGGVANNASNPTLTNVTMSGNSASDSGGGIYNLDSSPVLRNAIIWGNTASTFTQYYNDGSSAPTVSYSDIQGGYTGTGNLDLDPLLGDLGYYGGNTQVLPVQPGSPAIDVGDNATCASADQRGVSRPQGSHCDMGAFEAMQNLTGTLYVIPSGGTDLACASWTSACDLQYALAAADPGAKIWVKAGTYVPTAGTDRSLSFRLKTGVALYGGFAGSETARSQRDPYTNLTTLSGDIGTLADDSDNSYHVVIGSGTNSTAILDGFTISGGNADGASPDNAGGGMLNDAGSPTLTGLVFSDNSATFGGGGLHNTSGSSPTLNNITFNGNSTSSLGGGMLNSGSSPALTNVTFNGNTAAWGGGIYNSSSNPTLTNVTLRGNSATESGGGMDNSNSSPTIRNSILWGNTATSSAQIFDEAGSAPTVTYSDVQSGYSGTGNLNLDPLLGSPDYYGGSTPVFPLLPGSPAINTGEDATCASTDQRGLSRPQGVHCDMGTFEALSIVSSLYVVPSGGANLACASWSNACDLQYALAAANPGSEIWVKAGLYKPTSGTDRSVSFRLKNGVAIYGGFAGTETDRNQRDPYVNWTGLSGDIGASGDNSDNSYHVVVASGTNATAVLDGFNIQDGNTTGASPDNAGGGMFNDSGSPSLANLAFNNNTAITNGGGMYNIAGNPTLTDVSFNTNSAIIAGGGMYNESSHPILLDSSFYGNSAPDGGGIFNWSSSPSLTNITFSNNTGGGGGGMDNEIDSSPILTNVTFVWNSADSTGGGMLNAGTGSPVLTNVTFHGNSADLGAGVYNGSTSNPTLINVTIAGNNASSQGGGMYNSTHGNTTIRNSIIWDNNAPSDAQIFNDSIGSLLISYSDIQGSTIGSINLDPLLGSLSTYGTMQVLPLQTGSPAIDAVDTELCASTDQRGITRPQGTDCDMGAFEKVPGDRLYVIPNGATSGTCATWANACELRYALFIASAGSEVWVKGGAYTPTAGTDRKATFQLNAGVKVYGGFAGTETARSQRNPGVHLTTLSGDIGVSGAGSTSSPNLVPGNDANGTPGLGGFSLPGNLDATAREGDTLTLTIPGAVDSAPPSEGPAPVDDAPPANSTSDGSIPGSLSSTADGSASDAQVSAASGNSDNSFHVVTGSGADDTAVLDGFSIRGGNANGVYPYNGGGGMANSFSSPTLTNLTFTGNTAGWGGGLLNSSSSPKLTNITFNNNSATNYGGGLHNQYDSNPTLTNVVFSGNSAGNGGGMTDVANSNPTLTSVTFNGNTASYGGGMLNDSSSPALTQVVFNSNSASNNGGGMLNEGDSGSNPALTTITFSGNTAGGIGGGMYNWTNSNPAITNATFSSNSATYGGGMYNYQSAPTLVNIIFMGNSANNHSGGGIYNSASNPILTSTFFYQNSATWGAGIYNDQSNPTLTNATIAFNSAANYGGGIQNNNSSPSLTNVTIGGNYSYWGGGGMFDLGDSHPPIRDSIFWGNTTTVISMTYYGTVINPSQIYNYAGDISTSPIFYSTILGGCPYHSGTCSNILTSDPLLGYLGYYGNSTPFFPLGSGSPAINTAENATCAAYDQRGVSRPQGGTCDMGAFEQINGRLYASPGGKTSGNASGTCNSWANGCELRYALDIAGSVSEIWAAAGTYTPTAGTDRSATFQLLNGVAIYGGFGGYETTRGQRDPYAHLTTLSGDIGALAESSDNSYNVVIGSGTDYTAILDGFTIQDGYANGTDPQDLGGGMYINNGTPTLVNLILSGNAAVWGGGMYLAGSSPTLTEVTFRDNTAVENGGGMENYISNPSLFNVAFINNAATNGGGIFNTQGNATLTNVTFSGNNAGTGGGVFNDNSAPIFTNVTFGNNSATYSGGGMFNTSSSPLIRDSILWDSPVMDADSSGTPNFQYSLVQGGCPTYATCTNISTTNPLLGSLGAYGGKTQVLPLLPGSAAIDHGNNTSCASTDLRGVGRPQNGICDMGAFEARPFTLTITGGNNQSASINTAFVQPLALSVGGTNGDPVNGGVINFTAPASGASAALSSTSVTIVSGATSVIATANSVSGPYDVMAGASGVVVPVLFHLTNIVPASPTSTRTATTTSTRTSTATPTRTASHTPTSTQTRTGTQSTSTRTLTATPSAVYYHVYLPLTLKEAVKP